MTAPRIRPRPTKASHKPTHRPPAELRARLERHDEASDALARFYRGEIGLMELGHALEQATEKQNTP
jgi:hypothetical protein